MRLFIGVDPGVSGGIAAVDQIGLCVYAHAMPTTEADLLRVFNLLGEQMVQSVIYDSKRALIERVGASPQMGVVSAFTFGKNYGKLLMALTAIRVPFEEISPIKWQNLMGSRTGGDKNVSKRRAQQLFPAVTITHAIADALLLAECCRRLEQRVSPKERHGEEESGRQEKGGGAEAVEGKGHGLEEFVARGQAAQTAAERAIAGAAGHGARAQHPSRQPVRGHRRRA